MRARREMYLKFGGFLKSYIIRNDLSATRLEFKDPSIGCSSRCPRDNTKCSILFWAKIDFYIKAHDQSRNIFVDFVLWFFGPLGMRRYGEVKPQGGQGGDGNSHQILFTLLLEGDSIPLRVESINLVERYFILLFFPLPPLYFYFYMRIFY